MNSIYIAIEMMAALIILIVLYANIFENKQKTMKANHFTQMLILDVVIVLSDAISWFKLPWAKMPAVLWCLVMITYIVPYLAQAVFAEYLYEHISERTQIKKLPFLIVIFAAAVFGVISLIMCGTGKLFTIENGKFYPGPFEPIYFLFYIASLMIIAGIILLSSKKMSVHDSVAAFMFCFIPAISIVLSMSELGINLSVAGLAIEVLVIYIMLQSEGEVKLIYKSNNDELTGLYNRRAYEEDISGYTEKPLKKEFVYASIDVNGLKQVNDNLGHAAGDEIISGAAECLKTVFGAYGKVYRIGGDEFAAIFSADEEKLQSLIKYLAIVVGEWKGNIVDSLSVSVGFASRREFPEMSVVDMSKIADSRMYKDKSNYYSKKGIDRRGQSAAYTALCNLYTKILKVNLTTDTYSIANVDETEKTVEKGFAETISGWLTGFGKSGQIHEEDLDYYLEKIDIDYLRKYFESGEEMLSIQYRRKIKEEFKMVVMEMIRADDYEDNNQTLFLYVK